ncbi:hypothetical protein E3N88_40479 [Mikania micrantha]|uniref:Uncharacterized protein n=1 Tax=Mikania micrantha TaxID=192012 RepID=A0A5N6LMQ2_9ASTR|nr:hypothetical protein E3N88_40479 [Mikania micrantha]
MGTRQIPGQRDCCYSSKETEEKTEIVNQRPRPKVFTKDRVRGNRDRWLPKKEKSDTSEKNRRKTAGGSELRWEKGKKTESPENKCTGARKKERPATRDRSHDRLNGLKKV